MNGFGHIGLTFKSASVSMLNQFVIPQNELESRLSLIKEKMGWNELIYLSTCNRIEFYFHTTIHNHSVYKNFLTYWKPDLSPDLTSEVVKKLEITTGSKSIEHLMRVATSIDSMVVGETEVLKQVKDAHQQSIEWGLSGRQMHFMIRAVIECSKKAFSKTGISLNPVSVASMTYRSIKNFSSNGGKITLIGAGEVIQSMIPYLSKQQKFQFHFVNRTETKAKELAVAFNGTFQSLSDHHLNPVEFDVLISCTSADNFVFTLEAYQNLSDGKRLLIDLANPKDIDPAIAQIKNVSLISLENIEKLAEENNKIRQAEIVKVEKIIEENISEFKQNLISRQIDSYFFEMPEEIENIKKKALDKIIRTKLKHLPVEDQKVISEFADYLSNKFIQVPMITAKKILIEQIEETK